MLRTSAVMMMLSLSSLFSNVTKWLRDYAIAHNVVMRLNGAVWDTLVIIAKHWDWIVIWLHYVYLLLNMMDLTQDCIFRILTDGSLTNFNGNYFSVLFVKNWNNFRNVSWIQHWLLLQDAIKIFNNLYQSDYCQNAWYILLVKIFSTSNYHPSYVSNPHLTTTRCLTWSKHKLHVNLSRKHVAHYFPVFVDVNTWNDCQHL